MGERTYYAGLRELEEGVYRFKIYRNGDPVRIEEVSASEIPEEFSLGDYFYIKLDESEDIEDVNITSNRLVFDKELTRREKEKDQQAVKNLKR